jgi:hypothetical protein
MACISHLVESHATANALYVSTLRLKLTMTVPGNVFLEMVLDIGIVSSKSEGTEVKKILNRS